MEDVMALSSLDPEFERVLANIGQPPKLHGSIKELRAMLSAAKANLTETHPEALKNLVVEEMRVPARDGYEIPVRVYKPEPASDAGSPLFVAFHGGGFCLGDLDTEELFCRLFAQEFKGVVVNVDYRLAPEHKFPTAPNDAWDAVQWVCNLTTKIPKSVPSCAFTCILMPPNVLAQAAANASKLGADPAKGFIVFGTSAGGNLTDVVGHLARDHQLTPPLTGLLEMIPAVLPGEVVPEKYKAEYLSFEQNKDAPVLDEKAMDNFLSMCASLCRP